MSITVEHSVCHECACILVNGEGDPDRYETVAAWSERVGYAVMACDSNPETGCDHPVSYVLPCDVCREVGSPFGLHMFNHI